MSEHKPVEKQYGHPKFYQLNVEEARLHNAKNHDYAAGGHPLGNFIRVSSILSMYPGLNLSDPSVVAMTYALKQLDAYLWIKSQGIVTKVEGIQERLTDISIYTKLVQCLESDYVEMSKQMERRSIQEHEPDSGPQRPTLRSL